MSSDDMYYAAFSAALMAGAEPELRSSWLISWRISTFQAHTQSRVPHPVQSPKPLYPNPK